MFYERIPCPFTRVRDFGLGNMVFSLGVLVYGVEFDFFLWGYGWFHSMVFIMWVLGWDFWWV